MFQNLKNKFEAKRAVWTQETQQRIAEYADFERRTALLEMEKNEKMQSLLNTEVEKYLRTVHPTFLLKPEVSRALLNMLYSRSEGTVSINMSMTKEMRKAYSFYHNELKIFLNLLERRGFQLEGNEDKFLMLFITKLRENNYRKCMNLYGDFVPDGSSLFQAFDLYFEVVEDEYKYTSGNVDFFASYLNQKEIVDYSWTKSRLKRKLKQYENANKHEFKLKQLEKRLKNIS
ncbi:hypothetical protein [Salipaludibacillus daqingensis]|uniref:hypothetical protein n=1 Tax=Salipaludibacillus daqingensis TaxID=3041001 RepID=UPI002474136F|nr:hypothetical protein [Salipaludibacillus daqingensis]